MNPLIYAWPGFETLAAAVHAEIGGQTGHVELRHFPDQETFVRLDTSPADRDIVLVCGLEQPDAKIMGLYFAAITARELGARSVGLVSPYLAYMRQDARFNPGEAITSRVFAHWLSGWLDWLVTMDPHLHRHRALGEIYSLPSAVASSASAIARWITAHVQEPLIIGPDAESAQWAGAIAKQAHCPFIVLQKLRSGDREVAVSMPQLAQWSARTPVLIDDIISTARTMIATTKQLHAAGSPPPVCVGVHALFCDDAFSALQAADVRAVVTCNTIKHVSNAIDVEPEIARCTVHFLRQFRR